MDLLTPQAQAAASSQDCWHMLYTGLIREFEELTDEEKGTHKTSVRYFDAISYSFRRFKGQAKKVRAAMLNA